MYVILHHITSLVVYNNPIVDYRHAQVSLATINMQCCLVVLRPDEELRELESLSLAIIIMFCIREKVLLLDISSGIIQKSIYMFSITK